MSPRSFEPSQTSTTSFTCCETLDMVRLNRDVTVLARDHVASVWCLVGALPSPRRKSKIDIVRVSRVEGAAGNRV